MKSNTFGGFLRNWTARIAFSAAVAALAGLRLFGAEPPLRVFTIGNSFSRSATVYLPAIADSLGRKLDLVNLYGSGYPLKGHWDERNVLSAVQDEDEKAFDICWSSTPNPIAGATVANTTLEQMLATNAWDIVLLQQKSEYSCTPASYEPYFGNLVSLIREKAPTARIWIHQTWSLSGARLSSTGSYPYSYADSDAMYDDICAAYGQMAATHAEVENLIPAGYAVQLCRHQLGFNPLGSDNWHLIDPKGKYLQACVWAAKLFGIDPTTITYRPSSLSAADATDLRAIARQAADATDYSDYGQFAPEPPVNPLDYGAADTKSVTYTWKTGVSGPWEHTTNWTASAATCHGIPNSIKATAVFPAALPAGTTATLTGAAIKLKRLELRTTAPFTLSLRGSAITIESGSSTVTNNLEIGKTGPATVEFLGASSQINSKSPYSWGRIRLGEAHETVLSFKLPTTPWTSATAPVLASGEDSPIAMYSNVCFVVDAAALLAPGEGHAVTNVLAWNADGVRFYDGEGVNTPEMRAAILARLEVRNAPEGTTGELVYADGAVSFVLGGGVPAEPPPDARVVVDATRQDGRILPNPVSTLTVWDGRWFRRETYPAFLDYVQLFTATGGSEARDLFVDPSDSSTLDDYDFAPLIEQCERVLACHCRPYLKLGSVPLKFCAEPDAGSFRFNLRPPDDGRYAAYDAYIRALTTALKDRFGLEEVRRWRFSVGSESNNKHWFCAYGATAAAEKTASKAAFFKLYDHTVKAVTDVLGTDLAIGTHLLGSDASSSMTMFTLNDFIAHCRSGANDATGGTGAPLGLLSVSYYVTAPGRNDAAAGRIADFASVRSALDAAGFTGAVIGMDEGRVDSGIIAGTEGRELVTRAVGQSWQMAFDLRCAKSVFDAGADNFSSWGHFAGPNAAFEGVPAMSYFTAREFARFAGLRRLENTVAVNLADGSAVDAISAVSETGDRVRLAVGHFRDQLVYTGEARTEVVVTLPAAMRGRSVPVATLVLDDSGNWFNDWIADRETYSIPNSVFYFSPDDQSPMMMAEDYPAIAALFRSTLEPGYLAKTATLVPLETAVEVPSDGVITLPLTLRGNAVAFITVGENEPYAADREPESESGPEPAVGRFDWLETDGTGYFVTDYIPNTAKTRIEFRLRFLDCTVNNGLAIANLGTSGRTSGDECEWGGCYYSYNARKATDGFFEYYTVPSGGKFETGFDDTNSVHTVVFGAGITALDGVTNTLATAADVKSASGPLALFAANFGKTTYAAMAKVRCYGLRIWEIDGDAETLVRDCIAATNASGAATLYDRVNGSFLEPIDGAGFAVGNDAADIPVPVIDVGPDGEAAIEIVKGHFKVRVTNANERYKYGYRKAATLAGLGSAPIDWLTVEVESGATEVTLSLPRDPGEPAAFYKLVVAVKREK